MLWYSRTVPPTSTSAEPRWYNENTSCNCPSVSRNPKYCRSCDTREPFVESCSEMGRTTPAKLLLFLSSLLKPHQFINSVQNGPYQGLQDWHSGRNELRGAGGGRTAVGSSFQSLPNYTLWWDLWDVWEDQRACWCEKGQARCSQLLLHCPCALSTSQVQLFASKITIQEGKKKKWQVLELAQEKQEECLDYRMRERKPSRKQQAVRWTPRCHETSRFKT